MLQLLLSVLSGHLFHEIEVGAANSCGVTLCEWLSNRFLINNALHHAQTE